MSEPQVNIQDVVAEFQNQFPREFTIAVQAVRIRKLEEAMEAVAVETPPPADD